MALVGFTRSYNDLQWLEMARVWAAEHEPAMGEAWATATQRIFDLRGGAGRNFLDDEGEYEVVVLFAIYNPPADSPDFRKALGRRRGQTSLAPNHSRERWARRLSGTRCFGGRIRWTADGSATLIGTRNCPRMRACSGCRSIDG